MGKRINGIFYLHDTPPLTSKKLPMFFRKQGEEKKERTTVRTREQTAHPALCYPQTPPPAPLSGAPLALQPHIAQRKQTEKVPCSGGIFPWGAEVPPCPAAWEGVSSD